MELYERIKYLRKNVLNMSQEKFGLELGVNRDVINNIERNRLKNPEQKEPLYQLICSKFGISEKWLRTGEGEMKIEDCKDNRYFSNVGKLQRADDETIMRWVNAIAETDPIVLKKIEEFMKKLFETQED